MNKTLIRHWTSFDASKALLDFDGDKEAVIEILREFLLDIGRRLSELSNERSGDREIFISIVHEIANTLGTAWFFDATRNVRAIEDRLRNSDESGEPDIFFNSHADILNIALESCREAQDVLQDYASGRDPFDGASPC